MSITLTELSKQNSFIYNQYVNNQIIGYKGTITNGSCYISNRTIREGMLIDYQSYTKDILSVDYICTAEPVNSILVVRGYDTKIDFGGGPQHGNSLIWIFIPANTNKIVNVRQRPESDKDVFYIYRIIL